MKNIKKQIEHYWFCKTTSPAEEAYLRNEIFKKNGNITIKSSNREAYDNSFIPLLKKAEIEPKGVTKDVCKRFFYDRLKEKGLAKWATEEFLDTLYLLISDKKQNRRQFLEAHPDLFEEWYVLFEKEENLNETPLINTYEPPKTQSDKFKIILTSIAILGIVWLLFFLLRTKFTFAKEKTISYRSFFVASNSSDSIWSSAIFKFGDTGRDKENAVGTGFFKQPDSNLVFNGSIKKKGSYLFLNLENDTLNQEWHSIIALNHLKTDWKLLDTLYGISIGISGVSSSHKAEPTFLKLILVKENGEQKATINESQKHFLMQLDTDRPSRQFLKLPLVK